ncbi:MAG: 23S rRNA (uracil(1939)-C(5))-methyltransferase RlmD [Myxococcota bacterium]
MARHVIARPDRWSPRGEAIAEEGGTKPLAVWSGIVGEEAEIRIAHVGHSRVQGEWIQSEVPHPHRVEPPCPKYRRCGGCPWMHLDGEGQAEARHTRVQETLAEAGLSVDVGPLHACPDGLEGYRHVVKVGFGRSDQGRIRVGAWARGSRDIVPIPECIAAAPVLRKVMASLAHHTIELGIEPYDPEAKRGVLRAAVLRASRSTGEVLVTLVAARRERRLGDLAEEIARGNSEIVGIWLHLNGGPGNAIFSRDGDGVVGVAPLGGREVIEEQIGDITYRIGPGDFFQTNPSMAEVLYRRTLDRLELSQGDALLDLYSGVGGLALPAARMTGFALGVEEVDGAVQRAREAARVNRVPAEFFDSDVDVALQAEIAERFTQVGAKVVVNPARRGLEPGVLEHLIALHPSRIAYISCNVTALARDLNEAQALGFDVSGSIELFDMFPNTAHVEALTILEPRDGGPAPKRRAPTRKLVRRR